jgi:hypothetical protein
LNETEAIHTAARRYCLEQLQERRARSAELDRDLKWQLAQEDPSAAGVEETQEEILLLAAGALALEAILDQVERLTPEEFPSLEEARARLAEAGQTGQNWFTSARLEGSQAGAIDHERQEFETFVREIGEDRLRTVEPLPYRRVLSEDEGTEILTELRARWGVEGMRWYPLAGAARPPHTEVFHAESFQREASKAVRALLTDGGTTRVWELREGGVHYEMDTSLLDPLYTGLEGLWSSEGLDWLIYASHEATVTVGGEGLLPALRSAWPEWRESVFRGSERVTLPD